jgi:hypothetical protein
MLVRLSHRLDRQDQEVEIVEAGAPHLGEHPFGDAGVDADGQVRPVLLDRRGRQDRDGAQRVEIDEGAGGAGHP